MIARTILSGYFLFERVLFPLYNTLLLVIESCQQRLQNKGGTHMDSTKIQQLAEAFLGAWNTQKVENVLACYSKDTVYRDPNTRGEIKGAESFGAYLQKLFSLWKMHWSLREAYSLSGVEGAAVLWHASLQKMGNEEAVKVDGMDLVILENDLITRNEVYFDRSVLQTLL